jgi:VanZ family protein
MISPITKIALFILLAVVSLVGHNYIKQYEKIGSEILSNNWSLQSSKGSTAEINGNLLYLFSLDYSKSVSMKQTILPVISGAILELSADIKCENVKPGVESYNRAKLILMQYDRDERGLNLPHHVASIFGTHEWDSYNNYFTISPDTKQIIVSAQLSHCTGSLWIKNIHLYPVIQTHAYTYFKIIILVIWAIYFIILLAPCFINIKNNIVIRISLVLVFILIIIGVTIPSDMKFQITDYANELINSLGVVYEGYFTLYLAKIGHFFFFFLFGLVFSFLQKDESDTMVITNIVLFAGSTEIMQLFIDGRSFLLWDIMIDLNGAFYGFILSKLLISIRRDI